MHYQSLKKRNANTHFALRRGKTQCFFTKTEKICGNQKAHGALNDLRKYVKISVM